MPFLPFLCWPLDHLPLHCIHPNPESPVVSLLEAAEGPFEVATCIILGPGEQVYPKTTCPGAVRPGLSLVAADLFVLLSPGH